MTKIDISIPKDKDGLKARFGDGAYSLTILALTVSFALFVSPLAAKYVKSGLQLCVYNVLPSTFPFFILSDLYISFGRPENLRWLGWVFERLFHIERGGACAFIVGITCGFPIGAIASTRLYRAGELSKESAERLMAISNLPSPAFIVGAVGVASFGSFKIGMCLLACTILSSLITATVLRTKKRHIGEVKAVTEIEFNLVKSIKSSGISAVNVCAFITAFSVVAGLISEFITIEPLRSVLIAFIEVSSASVHFASIFRSFPLFGIVGVAFSLGFGGISVMLQGAALADDTDLRQSRYFGIKALQGLTSALLAFLFFRFFI